VKLFSSYVELFDLGLGRTLFQLVDGFCFLFDLNLRLFKFILEQQIGQIFLEKT
jgi:hypothetical protein